MRRERTIENVRSWFEGAMDWMDEHIFPFMDRVARGFEHIGAMLVRAIIIGIILNIIAGHFWTELPEKMPTMYAFWNGALELGEFMYRNGFRAIVALFTETTILEVGEVTIAEWNELFQQFTSWITNP